MVDAIYQFRVYRLFAPRILGHDPGCHVGRCATMAGRETLQVLAHVVIQREHEIVAGGRPALLTRFESLTDHATLEVVSA